MLQSENNGVFLEVWDKDENEMVRNVVIRYLMTTQFKWMAELHKLTCGCETWIYTNSLHALLLLQRKIYQWTQNKNISYFKQTFRKPIIYRVHDTHRQNHE